MNEIICPHCHKAFKIDEAGYADILKQVRDREFEKTIHERLELAEKVTPVALAEAPFTGKLAKKMHGWETVRSRDSAAVCGKLPTTAIRR